MIISHPLPFFNERKLPINMLVIHSMAHPAEEGIVQLHNLQLSSHYVVDYDGTVYQCVDEEKRAWHAGVSFWRGETDINSASIGIEVCHPTLGQDTFPDVQIRNLIKLCHDIIIRHNIAPQMIVGHSDIAPLRKPDPGKCFPWQQFSKEGIGLWYSNHPHPENNVTQLLSIIGYDVSSEEKITAAAYAFCRHFLAENIETLPTKQLILSPFPKDKHILNNSDFINTLRLVANAYKNI